MVPTAAKRSPRTMEMSCQLFPKGSRTPQAFGHRPARWLALWLLRWPSNSQGTALDWHRLGAEPSQSNPCRQRQCVASATVSKDARRGNETRPNLKRSRRCPSDKKRIDRPLCHTLCPADCAKAGRAWLSFWTSLLLLPCFTCRNSSSSSCVFRSMHCFGIGLPDFFWNDYGAAL